MSVKLAWAAAACLLALPAVAEEVMIDSYAGEVSVQTGPETIAVLDVAAIDTLNALGVGIDGAPNDLFVDYLGEVEGNAVGLGTLFEPNYEELAKLAPDLIVAGGRSSRIAGDLAKVAPTIDMTIWGEDHVAQSLSRLNALAEITGTQAKAEELTASFNAKLDEAKAAAAGKGDALILLTNGGKISVYGNGSRFGWLHSAVGLPEAVEGVDAQTHGEAVSFEFVAEADPDWIIVVDRSAAIGAESEAAAETLDNPLVLGTKAAQNDQIIYVNSTNMYIAGGGIQSMSQTLDELLAAFKG